MFWKTGAKLYRRTDVKMTLWSLFTLSISFLIIGIFLYQYLNRKLIKEVDRFLLDETEELADVLSRIRIEKDALQEFENDMTVKKYYPTFFRILNENGDPVYSSRDFGDIAYKISNEVLDNARKGVETRENIHSSERYRSPRIISTPILFDGRLTYVIQMGTSLMFVKKSLYSFKDIILIVFPIMVVLSSLGGWFLARKSLSPIGYIASKTRTITSSNLGERLILRGTDDEMDDLIRTINEMISRLEGSFKRMAEFTADASHELKTPICAMKGEAEVLLSRGRTGEEYQEGLAHFVEQFDRLNQMIDNLILLSKFDSTEVALRMVPLRLDLLVKDIANLFEVLAEQKKLAFSVNILQEVTVLGDKTRLQQLFTNLIDNAIKYTLEGSIRITLGRNGETAEVKITDTGIGIPEEEQKNIFKRFYRVDKSRSKETGGAGLGLSIAEWIAQAHHGKIEVQSGLGEGSTLTVTLPLIIYNQEDQVS